MEPHPHVPKRGLSLYTYVKSGHDALASQYRVIHLTILYLYNIHTFLTMSDVRNQQIETAVPMADTACGLNLEVPYMDEGPSTETCNASGEPAASESNQSYLGFLLSIFAIFSWCSADNKSIIVPRVAGNLADEIKEFTPGMRGYFKNIRGIPGNSAIISSDINEDIDEFIQWWEEERGIQWTEDNKKVIKQWLPVWNMFLQAQAGETLVTCMNLFLTLMGFIFYIVDLGSDIGTSIHYASNGQWWRAILTLTFVYGTLIFYTGWKWIYGLIPCTGAAAWLRYVAALLVNWPDVQQYGALCLLEWKLHKSPAGSARLVPEWHVRRLNIAFLKFTEGIWEACPQVMLQLCLLVPDLYGDWTWTDYLRIAGASVSLCSAGAALVNWEKFDRIRYYAYVPLSELVVLHVWAGPVTVARLVSVTLLLTVHPYWTLVGVALHLILLVVHRCRTEGGPRKLADVVDICVHTLRLCISPYTVAASVTYRRVLHAIHFLVNTAATMAWAFGTPLVCANPALYTAILCFNAAMFVVGVVGWQLHESYWPRSYFA